MGLIGNRNVAFRVGVRHIGGTIANYTGAWSVTSRRSRTMSEAFTDRKIAYPVGYLHPYAFDMPLKPGGLSTFNQTTGTGALSATGDRGVNGISALAGTGSLTGTGGLIVSAVAALTGDGALAGAANATLAAVAALSGSGTLSGTIGALGGVIAALAGTGTLTAGSYATGTLDADILPYTELSPQSLAAAVWSALAASSNDAGSMGEKLNDAGSAANPWTETIESGLTAAQAMRLIVAAVAGKLSGAESTTITIRNAVADDTDRIIATVDEDGNRSTITYDLD
jgi:hypothetical protein